MSNLCISANLFCFWPLPKNFDGWSLLQKYIYKVFLGILILRESTNNPLLTVRRNLQIYLTNYKVPLNNPAEIAFRYITFQTPSTRSVCSHFSSTKVLITLESVTINLFLWIFREEIATTVSLRLVSGLSTKKWPFG